MHCVYRRWSEITQGILREYGQNRKMCFCRGYLCECKRIRNIVSGAEKEWQVIAMATEKKNPYVMTIGFKKNNPEHIQVAEFLNSLEREKAQYIVKAVLTYRTLEEKGEVPQTGGAVSYDYETIKSIVLQIMREQGADGKIPAVQPETASLQPETEPKKQITEEDPLIGFDESAMQGIMASLSAFQNHQ